MVCCLLGPLGKSPLRIPNSSGDFTCRVPVQEMSLLFELQTSNGLKRTSLSAGPKLSGSSTVVLCKECCWTCARGSSTAAGHQHLSRDQMMALLLWCFIPMCGTTTDDQQLLRSNVHNPSNNNPSNAPIDNPSNAIPTEWSSTNGPKCSPGIAPSDSPGMATHCTQQQPKKQLKSQNWKIRKSQNHKIAICAN